MEQVSSDHPDVSLSPCGLQLSLQEMKEQEAQRQERDERLQDSEKALAEEQAKIKAAEEEKEHFAKGCEELEQKMADQERTFNDKFASVEDKMREIGSQGNENSRKLDEVLQVMKELVVKCNEKDKQLQNAEKALAEEQAKIKAAEEEKEHFAKRCEELEQKMAYQERIFNVKFAIVEEKLREMKRQANKNYRKLDPSLGYKSMTDGGAVEVSLWKDGESPLLFFPHEGKLFLNFLLNVNGKEGFSKIYHIMEKINRLLHDRQNMKEGTSEENEEINDFLTSFRSFILMILKWLFH